MESLESLTSATTRRVHAYASWLLPTATYRLLSSSFTFGSCGCDGRGPVGPKGSCALGRGPYDCDIGLSVGAGWNVKGAFGAGTCELRVDTGFAAKLAVDVLALEVLRLRRYSAARL